MEYPEAAKKYQVIEENNLSPEWKGAITEPNLAVNQDCIKGVGAVTR